MYPERKELQDSQRQPKYDFTAKNGKWFLGSQFVTSK